MLHACFQLLKDCIEKEYLLDEHIDWDADEKYSQAKLEIKELYDWWLSYIEPESLEEESYEIENKMLMRLITVRWALWT